MCLYICMCNMCDVCMPGPVGGSLTCEEPPWTCSRRRQFRLQCLGLLSLRWPGSHCRSCATCPPCLPPGRPEMGKLVDKQEAQSRTVLASTGSPVGSSPAPRIVEKSLPPPRLQSSCRDRRQRQEREGAGRGWQTCSRGQEGLGGAQTSRVRAWVCGCNHSGISGESFNCSVPPFSHL